MAASTPTTPPATTSTKKRRRVILVNGWLRSWTYPKLWMAPLAHHLNTTRYQADVVLEVRGNTLPVQTADTEKYIQHLADLMGPDGPDAETYFIGQSIGCQVILRYLARLPPGAQVSGMHAPASLGHRNDPAAQQCHSVSPHSFYDPSRRAGGRLLVRGVLADVGPHHAEKKKLGHRRADPGRVGDL